MVIFVGNGGHAADIAAIAYRCGESSIRYVEIEDQDELAAALKYEPRYVLAMNDPRTRERLDVGARPVTYIDPSAVLMSTEFAPGVIIGAHTTIGPGVKLGRHVHINSGVTITRAWIGDYTTVSPGATVNGDVEIGAGSYIGSGATISNLCTIGPRSIVGAGAVVTPRTTIPPNQTWVGVPARKVA